jgi:lysyl-tRNA synthetase class 2
MDKYYQDRLKKSERLRELGVDPFGEAVRDLTPVGTARERFEEDAQEKPRVRCAGRVMLLRNMGKAAFFDLRDRSGKIQVYVRRDVVGEEAFKAFRCIEVGDIVFAAGEVDKTRTGEVTVFAGEVRILSKSLRPLPEKYHGLKDKELRYRRRHLDLIHNPEVMDTFLKRARIIRSVREFLDERGFVEVETPVLQPVYGGAAARPFTTHHHTLDMPLYLRIADELYLKRLLVGGMERVYEVAKNFRNEGMDRTHNPEFTFMECYQAFGDLSDMMDIVEQLVLRLVRDICGGTKLTYQGRTVDVSPPWKRVSMLDAIRDHAGVDLAGADLEAARRAARELGIAHDVSVGTGKLIDLIFSRTTEEHLVEPTFLVDYPVETTPLARRKKDDPALVDRFEPFLFGSEIGNAFTELNDPVEQRRRFEEQKALLLAGDEEAQMLDEDFIETLETAMPPAGGLGLGIDRIVMMLTDSPSIRDVILFPLMRPDEGE